MNLFSEKCVIYISFSFSSGEGSLHSDRYLLLEEINFNAFVFICASANIYTHCFCTSAHLFIKSRDGHSRDLMVVGFITMNQCLSPLMLWVWIPLMGRYILNTTLIDYVIKFVSDLRHDITEILLKVESVIKHHKS